MTEWDERLSRLEQDRENAAQAAKAAREEERQSSDSLFGQVRDLARWAVTKYQAVSEPPMPIFVDGPPRTEKPLFGKPRTVFPPRLQVGSGHALYIDHWQPDRSELGNVNIHAAGGMHKMMTVLDGFNRLWLATPDGNVLFLAGSPWSSPDSFKGWDQSDTAEWTVNSKEVAFKYSGQDHETQIAFQIKRAQEAAKETFASMTDRDAFIDSVMKYVGEHAAR